MNLRHTASFVLVFIGIATGLGTPDAPAGATFPGANGKIAFVRHLSGGSHIFTVNPDGSEVTQVTESPGYDYGPAWSPDGAKIAFTRTDVVTMPGQTGQSDIWAVNSDGSGLTKLTNDPGIDGDPAWSPDSAQIAFSSYREGVENFEIFAMNSDGSVLRQLTNAGDGYVSASPSWSPDGATIAFARGGQTIQSDICVMSAYGGGEVKLTSTPEFESSPDWSPDGSTIVFTRDSQSFGSGIFSVAGTGGDVRQVVTPGGEGDAAWSPDGSEIVYVARGPSGSAAIWTMNADGTDRVLVADNGDSPAWQPISGQGVSPQTHTPPGGDTHSAAASRAQGCVPEFQMVTLSPGPTRQADQLPVDGGQPDGDSRAVPLQAMALAFGGLLLAAGGYVVFRAGLVSRG